MPEIPSWITAEVSRWLRSVGASDTDEALKAEAKRALCAWDGPSHSLARLARILERLDELETASSDPNLLRLGAVYCGNEPNVTLPDGIAKRIAELPTAADSEGDLLSDAILSLGSISPQKYRQFLKELRTEHADLNDTEFRAKREELLQGLLSRTHLFRTPYAAKWAPGLRENLEGELAALHATHNGTLNSKTELTKRLSTKVKRHALEGDLKCCIDRNFDDTSSLEDVADLFSHKRKDRS
jgi:Uncharacterized protein conserved in bacteria